MLLLALLIKATNDDYIVNDFVGQVLADSPSYVIGEEWKPPTTWQRERRHLHRPSRALRAPRVTRARAYIISAHRARRHRFPSPLHARMRALRRRSLARTLARARAHVRCG